MYRKNQLIASAAMLVAIASFLLWSSVTATKAAPASKKSDAGQPVEPDMHEFMEYVFQPTYKRLKTVMAAEPSDNQAWKSIKADSLILAEGGNLLLIRQPEKKAADWVNHAEQVRNSGGEFYRAAQAKDFKKAKQHYESMLKNCNSCHQQFAHGEHQLTP